MTALDAAEARAADRCADLHQRETACLGCRKAVGEELVRAMGRCDCSQSTGQKAIGKDPSRCQVHGDDETGVGDE